MISKSDGYKGVGLFSDCKQDGRGQLQMASAMKIGKF